MEDTCLTKTELIFVSYSWKDKDVVDFLVKELKQMKLNLWIDYEKINLEKPLEFQLSKAIKNSTKFILIMSENTLKSEWVRFELSEAKKSFNKNDILKIEKNFMIKKVEDGFLPNLLF